MAHVVFCVVIPTRFLGGRDSPDEVVGEDVAHGVDVGKLDHSGQPRCRADEHVDQHRGHELLNEQNQREVTDAPGGHLGGQPPREHAQQPRAGVADQRLHRGAVRARERFCEHRGHHARRPPQGHDQDAIEGPDGAGQIAARLIEELFDVEHGAVSFEDLPQQTVAGSEDGVQAGYRTLCVGRDGLQCGCGQAVFIDQGGGRIEGAGPHGWRTAGIDAAGTHRFIEGCTGATEAA